MDSRHKNKIGSDKEVSPVVPDGVNANEAVNKGQLDKKVSKSGDTMTGNLRVLDSPRDYGIALYVRSANAVATQGMVIDGDGESTDTIFRLRSGPDPGGLINANTKFLVDGIGNVAIGKETASERLDVVGNGKFTGTVGVAPATDPTHAVPLQQVEEIAAPKLDKTANIQALWTGTQAEYDALTPDANTLYFIQ